MFTQEVTVNNEVGLHARPATYFIQKANEFKSGIWVEKDERRVNAKSLLGVLSLGIVKGTTITLIADGPDAKEAVESLTQLVSDQLGSKPRRTMPEAAASGIVVYVSICRPKKADTVWASLYSPSPGICASDDRNSTRPSTSPSQRIGAATATV